MYLECSCRQKPSNYISACVITSSVFIRPLAARRSSDTLLCRCLLSSTREEEEEADSRNKERGS